LGFLPDLNSASNELTESKLAPPVRGQRPRLQPIPRRPARCTV